MATSQEYIEFVCEQLVGIENVRYKKMFGEYMVYVNDKPVLLVCDNTVYVKKLPEIEELMSGAECGVPYDSAKEHRISEKSEVLCFFFLQNGGNYGNRIKYYGL